MQYPMAGGQGAEAGKPGTGKHQNGWQGFGTLMPTYFKYLGSPSKHVIWKCNVLCILCLICPPLAGLQAAYKQLVWASEINIRSLCRGCADVQATPRHFWTEAS